MVSNAYAHMRVAAVRVLYHGNGISQTKRHELTSQVR